MAPVGPLFGAGAGAAAGGGGAAGEAAKRKLLEQLEAREEQYQGGEAVCALRVPCMTGQGYTGRFEQLEARESSTSVGEGPRVGTRRPVVA